jgi:uncharacterized protein
MKRMTGHRPGIRFFFWRRSLYKASLSGSRLLKNAWFTWCNAGGIETKNPPVDIFSVKFKIDEVIMGLQENLKKDLTSAMKEKNEGRKDAIRVIMGEFGRGGKKELSDEEVVAILKKLVKSEKELLAQKGEEGSSFLEVVESYLPKQASNEEIISWIKANIDFAQFKNKMQAMGPIIKHFGAAADGNAVKQILQEM